MAYWLFKSEPETWSWDQQVARGAAGEPWDGVRNYAARNNMAAMKVGELGFFYHSGAERRIAGIVRVSAAAHPDPKDVEGRWGCVDVVAVMALPAPVPLAAIRAEPRLAAMALVKQSRLSVQPVTADEWRLVCAMGGLKTPPAP